MIPGTLNLTVYRGAAFSKSIICQDDEGAAVNLTGWTAYAQVRTAPGKPVILDLEPTIPVPVLGGITISFTDEETEGLAHGSFVWDLMLENPAGSVDGPFLAGTFVIKSPVTRS